jgi:hypothetical protein
LENTSFVLASYDPMIRARQNHMYVYLRFVLVFWIPCRLRVFFFGLKADLSNTAHAKVLPVEVHGHGICVAFFTRFLQSFSLNSSCTLFEPASINVTPIGANPVSGGKPAHGLYAQRPYSATPTTLQRESALIDEVNLFLPELPTKIKRDTQVQPRTPDSGLYELRNSR